MISDRGHSTTGSFMSVAGPAVAIAIVCPLAAIGCDGAIGNPGGSSGDPQYGTLNIGEAPLRRLTHAEYNATVHDLLGDTSRPADRFPPIVNPGGFTNDVGLQLVSPSLAAAYLKAAEHLAAGAALDSSGLLECDPNTQGEPTCVQSFIERFGKRTYRRPLSADEVTQLMSLFDTIRARSTFSRSLELVLTAMLSSPHFLYRPELGIPIGDGPWEPLSQYEIASRMSYLFWGTMPDEALFAAADEGNLKAPEQLEARAREMLADPRARQIGWQFVAEWLGLVRIQSIAKSDAAFPEFDDALRDAMAEESQKLVSYVLWEGDGSLTTLLTAPVAFVNGPLASIYGVDAPPSAGEWMRIELDSAQRAGILTSAGLLSVYANSVQTDPVRRGILVRERLLCDHLPPPPPDIMPIEPEPSTADTTRERYAQHSADPSCAYCHELIDPIGFGFEHYDPIGRWRDEENGVPIDASGEITDSRTAGGSFDGVPELARRLASSTEVAQCAARQWFQFAFGRAETADDEPAIQGMLERFQSSGLDLRELMVAVVGTRAFTHKPTR